MNICHMLIRREYQLQLSGDSYWGTMSCGRRRGRRGWGQAPHITLCQRERHKLCHPRQLNRCCCSRGAVAGGTIEGRGPGNKDKGGGWQRAMHTEGC